MLAPRRQAPLAPANRKAGAGPPARRRRRFSTETGQAARANCRNADSGGLAVDNRPPVTTRSADGVASNHRVRGVSLVRIAGGRQRRHLLSVRPAEPWHVGLRAPRPLPRPGPRLRPAHHRRLRHPVRAVAGSCPADRSARRAWAASSPRRRPPCSCSARAARPRCSAWATGGPSSRPAGSTAA